MLFVGQLQLNQLYQYPSQNNIRYCLQTTGLIPESQCSQRPNIYFFFKYVDTGIGNIASLASVWTVSIFTSPCLSLAGEDLAPCNLALYRTNYPCLLPRLFLDIFAISAIFTTVHSRRAATQSIVQTVAVSGQSWPTMEVTTSEKSICYLVLVCRLRNDLDTKYRGKLLQFARELKPLTRLSIRDHWCHRWSIMVLCGLLNSCSILRDKVHILNLWTHLKPFISFILSVFVSLSNHNHIFQENYFFLSWNCTVLSVVAYHRLCFNLVAHVFCCCCCSFCCCCLSCSFFCS